MPRPRNISRQALVAYGRRKRELERLGFSSYDEYLSSPLWGRIRTEKLREQENACYGCLRQDAPVNVHHSSYERAVLQGKAPHRLFVVCDECHKQIEFIGKMKIGPGEATEALRKLRAKNLGKGS